MKVYVKLGLNTEYHGYDIFEGVYKTLEEAIDVTAFRWSPIGADLQHMTYTHKDEDDEQIHTHVVFFNKRNGTPTAEELKDAVEEGDEMNFYDSDNCYIILESVVIEEREL